MREEIELKLAIHPEHASRLLRHPLLKSRARTRSEKLHSVYYDTVAFDLKQRGFALRLRRIGRLTVQTLKREGKSEGGLHERPEWEAQASSDRLNIAALKETPLAELSELDELKLRPVFTTEFKRTRRVLETAEHSIEFALDRGSISAQDRSEAISEIELELVRGEPAHLFELALQLNKAAPLKIANASKAERGYALAAGRSRQPVKAQTVILTPNMTVSDALKAIAFSCIAHYQANAGEPGEDPEYVHQMRVGLRRLRSALNLFAMAIASSVLAPFRDEIRWLARSLGAARDWDVFMIDTLPEILRQFPDHPGLKSLMQSAQEVRLAANREARDAASSPRAAEFFLRLSAWLVTCGWMNLATESAKENLSFPVAGFASAVLDKRHKQVMKRGGLSPTELDAEARHRLRIAVKKLRYAAEFFAVLFSKKRVKKYIAGLMAAQDALGALNDAAVTERLVATLPNEPEATGMVRAFTAQQSQNKMGELAHAWEAWLRAKTFW